VSCDVAGRFCGPGSRGMSSWTRLLRRQLYFCVKMTHSIAMLLARLTRIWPLGPGTASLTVPLRKDDALLYAQVLSCGQHFPSLYKIILGLCNYFPVCTKIQCKMRFFYSLCCRMTHLIIKPACCILCQSRIAAKSALALHLLQPGDALYHKTGLLYFAPVTNCGKKRVSFKPITAR